MFEPLPARFDFPEAEKRVLEFWDEHDIFERTLAARRGCTRFVFYEGPPTANGLPHPGHCLTRAIKDAFPRYQTMCGKLVERKAGWDTHGLPVEVEVCKELGIHSKDEIEQYGVEKFVRKCIESVFKYTRQWEHMTRRLGFWVNLDDAYVTYHQSYVESVWWGLKNLFERGLLYQGHKVVWWWAQGGTALSAGEVGEGYRTVDDPSVFVRFPLADPGVVANHIDGLDAGKKVSLLVWTTTPWTLISNHFAAVHPELEYALVYDAAGDEYLFIARPLVEQIAAKVKRELKTVGKVMGTDMVGWRYVPPFDGYWRQLGEKTAALKAGGQEPIGWRVVAADFVTLDAGTGLVHQAPAYGEVDFDLLQNERARFADFDAVPLVNAVAPDGTFTDEAPAAYRGRWVKDCDKEIIRELRERGVLYHSETYRHEYPFCPRAEEDPLIQYARKSWFVRTSRFKEEFLKNNEAIHWLPEHIREGRFGDFLRNNVDWALSRERFWGTPLPIWVCEQTGKMEAVGSYDELLAKPGVSGTEVWERAKAADPDLPEHLKVHKPYIDAICYDSPFAAGARMRRVPEVIDCWWDAGSMPFAQWGFPHAAGSVGTFAERFPADFISEAIDQTRGWFYGLLAISTLLFGPEGSLKESKTTELAPVADKPYPHPYKTCIVLGHVMGEDALKMSKRTKNYKEPDYIFDHYGADAMRWYFYSAQTPWTSIRFQEAAIRDAQREFLVRLYNVFSFFNIYANIDGFAVRMPDAEARQDGACPCAALRGTGWRPVEQRCQIDRWIISELHRTIRFVREKMDAFENYPAAGRINDFVDALSNWYVRRCRERFWRSAKDQDKWDAYNTLYEVLVAVGKLIAPFTPFFAETIYQNLVRSGCDAANTTGDTSSVPLSVHLCAYPAADETLIDENLAQEMHLVRQIVSTGRAARTGAKLKVRQPLARVEVILAWSEYESRLKAYADLIAEELNVKHVEFTRDADQYVRYQVKPNFKSLGPKFGKLAPAVGKALGALEDPAAARKTLLESEALPLTVDGKPVTLTRDDVDIRLEPKEGWSAAQSRVGVVVVSTELTPELREEGLMRELIHHVQSLRKKMELPYEARITLRVAVGDEFAQIVRKHAEIVQRECLIERIEFGEPAGDHIVDVTLDEHPLRLAITPLHP